jgi:diguanylate cyclase (GGDEF)-like protein
VATACCRTEDLVARAGGEEFVVVLPATNEAQATLVAERLRNRLSSSPAPGVDLGVTASFGVAERSPGEALDALLLRVALYRAKHTGRDRVVSSSGLSAVPPSILVPAVTNS